MFRQLTRAEVGRVTAGEDARDAARATLVEATASVAMGFDELAHRVATSEGRLRHLAGPAGAEQVRLLGEALRAVGRRLVVATVRLGPEAEGDGPRGPYRHWTRDLPEGGAIMRHADEVERLEAEVARHLAAAGAAREAAREREAVALADALRHWSSDEVEAARRNAADV